jgi:hypothetical protein
MCKRVIHSQPPLAPPSSQVTPQGPVSLGLANSHHQVGAEHGAIRQAEALAAEPHAQVTTSGPSEQGCGWSATPNLRTCNIHQKGAPCRGAFASVAVPHLGIWGGIRSGVYVPGLAHCHYPDRGRTRHTIAFILAFNSTSFASTGFLHRAGLSWRVRVGLAPGPPLKINIRFVA